MGGSPLAGGRPRREKLVPGTATIAVIVAVAVLAGVLILFLGAKNMMFNLFYHKVRQGQALVRTGWGGVRVSFSGMVYIPMMHVVEVMDISVKRVEIERAGKNGLICRDNLRADIKVAFFVRVNGTEADALRVAQSVGCQRASDIRALFELFDAKFSEALKTVGKKFDFVELYTERERFKNDIIDLLGRDLNGYVLEDAAIDYLEQTPKEVLSPDNILDAEGIKKITDLTAQQLVLANNIERDKEKTITKQNVEAQEAILELNRQLAEKEEIQRREIASIKAREEAETARIQHEERLKAENARIRTDEELAVAGQNKDRQIIVATRAKERTDAVETERVARDRALEVNERERIVTLAQIEKEKAVEEERKNIQDVIRERVIVEKAVVTEEEAIKDTRARAGAEREKLVAVTKAQEVAEQKLVAETKAAEALRIAAEKHAERVQIEAEAKQKAASREAEAMKMLADARAAEAAVEGLSEANVMEAKARAHEKEGAAQAVVVERLSEAKRKDGAAEAEVLLKKAEAEAAGQAAKAAALEKQGEAEALVMTRKYTAEADGIEQKAEAMKKLDGVGREHEEYKLQLDLEKEVELARIGVQVDLARAQAEVLGEAVKSARIDIVGGEAQFFERIAGAITQGKAVDRLVTNSEVLGDVRQAILGDDAREALTRLRGHVKALGLTSADVRDLSLAALVLKMVGVAPDDETKGMLRGILQTVRASGLGDRPASSLLKG